MLLYMSVHMHMYLLQTRPCTCSKHISAYSTSLIHACTPTGVSELERTVLEVCTGSPDFGQGGGPASWAVNERQAEALVRASEALDRTRASVAQDLPIDFWTIDLREVIVAFGEVTGDEITEEVLDNIFSRFCIGK